MMKFLISILLIILIGCNNNTIQRISMLQQKEYTKEQINSKFVKNLTIYQNQVRDSIFKHKNLRTIKSFKLIENISSFNGNIQGCFISKNLNFGFNKNSYIRKIEYSDSCKLNKNLIIYFDRTDQEVLSKLHEELPVFDGGKYYYFLVDGKHILMKNFLEFGSIQDSIF